MIRYMFIFCTLLQSLLFGEEAIAKVIFLEGTAKVLKDDGRERALAEGAQIFVEETIVVGDASRTQVRFTDGGEMNLIADTRLRMDTYRYKVSKVKDQFAVNLIQGSLRLLSGSIAKKNPEGYEVRTPSAVIGLRGTIIEVSVVGAQAFFGVSAGNAIVFNSAGSVRIGVGSETSFASVTAPGMGPQTLLQRPPTLNPSLFIPPSGGAQPQPPAPSQKEPQAKPSAPTKEVGPPTKEVGPSIHEEIEPTESGTQPTKGGGATIQSGC